MRIRPQLTRREYLSAHNEIKRLLQESIESAALKSNASKESMMTDCFDFYKQACSEETTFRNDGKSGKAPPGVTEGVSIGVLSKNHLDKVSLLFKQKIKKWGVKSKNGAQLSANEVEILSNKLENDILFAIKKFSLQSQQRKRGMYNWRVHIADGKNNISRMRNFNRPTMIGSMTILKSQNELMKSGNLENAKFSEGTKRSTKTQIRTNIKFESSQISGSMDNFPLTRMNSKQTYNRRKRDQL